jgi:hypothetical protein
VVATTEQVFSIRLKDLNNTVDAMKEDLMAILRYRQLDDKKGRDILQNE